MSTQELPGPLFKTLSNALQGELDQLNKLRQETTLFSGEQLHSYAGYHYYRFEISEDIVLRGIENVTLSFGQKEPLELPGKIISLENQYLTLAVPTDFGPGIPEARCRWSYQDWLKPVLDQLASTEGKTQFAELLFNPAASNNQSTPSVQLRTLPATSPEQQTTLQKIMQNRVTLLLGPILTGKTQLLAMLAASFVKAGKKVLFVAPTSERVDETLVRTVAIGTELGIDLISQTTRVGLPLVVESALTTKLSFEYQVEEAKKKNSQGQVLLLEDFWGVRVRQVLGDDYYTALGELRQRAAESKKQLDQVTVELAAGREQLKKFEGASMLEKMKKSYKDELAAVQKLVAEKQAAQKKLQTMAGTLSNEVLKLEDQAPVRGEETKAFQSTLKQINDLGGAGKLREAIDLAGSANEEKVLQSKNFIGTTLTTALSDPRVRKVQFDLVIVQDAEVINLPSLAALASHASDKMVVAGDPFEVDPESVSNSALSQQWLQRDIFMHVAQTDDLHRLHEFSQQQSGWNILLSSQYAATPKLSQFVATSFLDGKVNVSVPQNAKGKIYFIDTTSLRSKCQQYVGRKKILPYNDPQARKAIEYVKHALMEPQRTAFDVGLITPFSGPSMYHKQLLRLQGIKNLEVGTPHSFRGRRKKAIIFDTVMAGVDYTVRTIDDRKVGEEKIASLLNTVFSCVSEDLYVLADMTHFQSMYKDRLFTKLLMQLQSQADSQPNLPKAIKQFDELEWEKRAQLFDIKNRFAKVEVGATTKPVEISKEDAEFAMRMKMVAKAQAASGMTRNVEQESLLAVLRVLGRKFDINLLSQYIGGELLFRHSLTTEQASTRLRVDPCQNEKEFRTAMERWNLLVYEKTGGSKNSTAFYTKQGAETRIRSEINAIKAYYSVEIGGTAEEGKQKLAVSKVFQEIIGKPMPTNTVEWSASYLAILVKLESYLSWVSEQLRK